MTKEVNIFELASREKLRFNTGRLQVTVEQLWELPLTGANSLDTLAVELDAAIRNTAPRSFVTNSATAADKTLQLQFDIVKHVIDVRVAERKAKAEKAEKDQQQQAEADPQQREQQQATEQWLNRIPDDPAGLWRRKFQYQYQQRGSQAAGEAW